MKTLYLMRHGETLFNIQKKNQGWCDSPLTEIGIKQAEIARDYFKNNNITFDAAYASTSERACDTLEIITEGKMDYKRVKGLKEWNFGAYEGKDNFLNPKLPYGSFFVAYGGEDEIDFQNRVVSTIKDIMDQETNETILMVSHGASCAQFCRYYGDYSDIKYKPGIKNCAIFKYEYNGEYFVLQEIVNHDFSHLK